MLRYDSWAEGGGFVEVREFVRDIELGGREPDGARFELAAERGRAAEPGREPAGGLRWSSELCLWTR